MTWNKEKSENYNKSYYWRNKADMQNERIAEFAGNMFMLMRAWQKFLPIVPKSKAKEDEQCINDQNPVQQRSSS